MRILVVTNVIGVVGEFTREGNARNRIGILNVDDC